MGKCAAMNVFLRNNTGNRRSGVTLIEMLVVVAIMMFMLTIAAPMFQPDQDGAVARDTARSLNAYIQEARAKAMATGRPCGVAFIPFENYKSACVVAQQVECQPLYTGESYQSTVTVSGDWDNPKLNFNDPAPPALWTTNDGNMIRLGGRGVWYYYDKDGKYNKKKKKGWVLQDGDANRPDADFRPWTNGNWTTTYEIQAAPIAQAKNYLQSVGMAEPLKVIRGSAIDLYYSKMENAELKNNAATPTIIMFNPTGEMGTCYKPGGRGGGTSVFTPSEKIYILCGQWDRALQGFTPEDGKRNNQTFDSYWIVIDPSTGISTIEQNIPE